MMTRKSFRSGQLTLSYLDAGGGGSPLVAMHALFMEAATFGSLAAALSPGWRVVALDLRGHGRSEHAPAYGREEHLGDLEAFLDHLGLEKAVLLGHSLGGVNAYQFAARHPARVRALVIEDIGAEVRADFSFALAWAGEFETREAFAARVPPHWRPHLEPSLRESPGGLRLAFEPQEMLATARALEGDHWPDWLASTCPALLVGGRESRVTTPAALEEMVARRGNARLELLSGGHVVHADDPEGFRRVVSGFLTGLERRGVIEGSSGRCRIASP